ncbi:NUDIX domain-containing protein [Kineosporia sp. R_H_3]|uniref:NUDIX domain-containing protein n=1 Tax=Kineosporia sp. R_H_3 TaxID=1961848 RepID=UPI001E32C552|nr:NUDIX domain-containing protein [Kineosporia sp. R_H_3]
MSADEVVALYDPDDVCGRVVGSAPRSRVRAENLPHAATGVLLRRPTGEVFVHRRARTKDLWPGAHDCAAGGVVNAGESPLEAARRELAEELGVEGAALTEVFTGWYRDDDTHYLAHVYEAVWDGPVRFVDDEVEDGWWEHPAVLTERLADPAWPFVPDTRRLLATGGLLGAGPEPVPGGRWEPGETVVYRWGREGRTRFARLARVVRHDDDGLLLWVGPGWPVVEQSLADGRGVREAPLEQRFTAPRARRSAVWRGPGILMLVPPGPTAWSVWWFFGTGADGARTFEGWYGNLEAPHALRTTALGTRLVDSADRALDVWVTPDRTAHWKDEDEFAAITALGTRWTAEQAPQIRADGEQVMALARAGAPPFDGRWTDFSPDPAWPVPRFPADWDVPHVAGP